MFRKLFPILISLFFLSGCAGTLGIFGTNPLEQLREDIDFVLQDTIFVPTHPSIKVVSLKTGEILYEKNSKTLIRPASNMKLLTSATALAVLGPDYKFKTAVYIDSQPINGILKGNIYIKGFGNPDLTTKDIDSLIFQISQQNIKQMQGDLIVDVSFFDSLYWGSGWIWDDEPAAYQAFISPLALNKNCIRVNVKPGTNPKDSAIVSIEPSTSYIRIQNSAVTVQDSLRYRLTITRPYLERENIIIVQGAVQSTSAPRFENISVWKPELYAGIVFKERLEMSGIIINGSVKVGNLNVSCTEIASHFQPMDSMIINLNKESDNLSAEMTLKTIAAKITNTPGTTKAGIHIVNTFLASLSIDTTRFEQVDGSGLSYNNLLTSDMLCQLLIGMSNRSDLFPLFFESLPIAGVDGTLRNRMKNSPAQNNLRAKTGTISGVSSLSGYVKTIDDEMLVFSMSMQNFITSTSAYKKAQDRIGAILAGWSRTRKQVAER